MLWNRERWTCKIKKKKLLILPLVPAVTGFFTMFLTRATTLTRVTRCVGTMVSVFKLMSHQWMCKTSFKIGLPMYIVCARKLLFMACVHDFHPHMHICSKLLISCFLTVLVLFFSAQQRLWWWWWWTMTIPEECAADRSRSIGYDKFTGRLKMHIYIFFFSPECCFLCLICRVGRIHIKYEKYHNRARLLLPTLYIPNVRAHRGFHGV